MGGHFIKTPARIVSIPKRKKLNTKVTPPIIPIICVGPFSCTSCQLTPEATPEILAISRNTHGTNNAFATITKINPINPMVLSFLY